MAPEKATLVLYHNNDHFHLLAHKECPVVRILKRGFTGPVCSRKQYIERKSLLPQLSHCQEALAGVH